MQSVREGSTLGAVCVSEEEAGHGKGKLVNLTEEGKREAMWPLRDTVNSPGPDFQIMSCSQTWPLPCTCCLPVTTLCMLFLPSVLIICGNGLSLNSLRCSNRQLLIPSNIGAQ